MSAEMGGAEIQALAERLDDFDYYDSSRVYADYYEES